MKFKKFKTHYKFCVQVECPNTDGTSFQSFGRRKRKADIILDDIENENVLESVNGRLRVFVEGEDGAPSKDDLAKGVIGKLLL